MPPTVYRAVSALPRIMGCPLRELLYEGSMGEISPDRIAGPHILLSAGCLFHLPLKLVARIGRDAGFAGMELIMNSPKLTPDAGLEVISEVLPIRSLHAPFRDWSAWGGIWHPGRRPLRWPIRCLKQTISSCTPWFQARQYDPESMVREGL